MTQTDLLEPGKKGVPPFRQLVTGRRAAFAPEAAVFAPEAAVLSTWTFPAPDHQFELETIQELPAPSATLPNRKYFIAGGRLLSRSPSLPFVAVGSEAYKCHSSQLHLSHDRTRLREIVGRVTK